MTKVLCTFLLLLFLYLSPATATAQAIAIIASSDDAVTARSAETLSELLKTSLKVQDLAMSSAAFRSVKVTSAANLTDVEAKRIGQVLGTNIFLLVDAAAIRRSASSRPEYYECVLSTFLVDAKDGRLVKWRLITADAESPDRAEAGLQKLLPSFAKDITGLIKSAADERSSDPGLPAEFEVAVDDTTFEKGGRNPVPFSRLKPQYTQTAFDYDISATVDIIVGLDESGRILDTRITRWAGYGLDEAVEKAVRSMNWRPAERNGKFVRSRFLLRYNFKKPDKKQ